MGMAHSSSGRNAYTSLRLTFEQRELILEMKAKNSLSDDVILNMLRRENELRISESAQKLYGVCTNLGHYAEVTTTIQRKVADEFGIPTDLGVALLRCAEDALDEDSSRALAKEISLYRKYNRLSDGNLAVADVAPAVTVQDMSGEPSRLFDPLKQLPRRQVLVAGSLS